MARLIKGHFFENGAVDTDQLANGAVDENKIVAGAVVSTKIANGAVITARLADDAVTNAKLATDSVDSDQLVDGSVDGAHIAADAVGAAKIKIAYGDSIRLVNSGGSVVGISIDSDGDLVGPDTNKIASQSYVSTAISNLIDSAPGALDTLNELAAAINDDASFSTTINNLIGAGFTGAGLNTNGSYTAVSGGTYLGSETSLKGGLSVLDSSLSSAVTSLTNSISSNVSTLNGKIDTIEASVGLSAAGAFVSFSGTNYMDSATSIVGSLEDLDTQAKTNADNIASNTSSISGLSSLIDTHESSIGLNANGTLSAPSGTNYLGSITTVLGASVALDTQVKTTDDKVNRALAVVPKQDVVALTSTDVSNQTLAFELDYLARWHDGVVVQYGNLMLVPGASYDFTVASDASAQTTTITLNSDYNPSSGSKAYEAGDVLVIRYSYDASFTYA
jgi:outer membrane murein-binding lipoprotein Lpp